MNYWQIGAGDEGRDYANDFIRFGMGFVGGKRFIDTMATVKAGDRIILKWGVSAIVAVGEVVERNGRATGNLDKPWLRDFDGWDLSAYCYVRWHRTTNPHPVKGLTQGTIFGVNKTELRQLADKLLTEWPAETQIQPEPRSTRLVTDDEILEFLVREGLRPGAAEELTSAFRRIRLLADYYYKRCQWNDVREHETRTFLIIPLLLALGWPEQQLKIELNTDKGKADVAGFSRPYRRGKNNLPNNEDCVLILESKGFTYGLSYASNQAKNYAEHFPNCRVVVVSNGYCYKVYPKDADGTFRSKPSAYLNLRNPQDRYPVDPDNVDGCLEVLRLLLPVITRT